jgi:tetratricopeptide (TPR) repeat protein
VLVLLDRGDERTARQLLSWLRDDANLTAGDDPLGDPLGVFLQTGEWRLAAAYLMIQSDDARTALPILRGAADSSWAARFGYARACLTLGLWEEGLRPATSLISEFSQSRRALHLLLDLYEGSRNWLALKKAAEERLAKDPNDAITASLLAGAETAQGHFAAAQALYRARMTRTGESAFNANNYGWNAVLAGDVTLEKVRAVEETLDASDPDTKGSLLHTIAAMHAELGNSTKARDYALRAMDAWRIEEPNDKTWYVLGRISEQLGLRDAALRNYQRATRLSSGEVAIDSTCALARRRMAALGEVNGPLSSIAALPIR